MAINKNKKWALSLEQYENGYFIPGSYEDFESYFSQIVKIKKTLESGGQKSVVEMDTLDDSITKIDVKTKDRWSPGNVKTTRGRQLSIRFGEDVTIPTDSTQEVSKRTTPQATKKSTTNTRKQKYKRRGAVGKSVSSSPLKDLGKDTKKGE
tara:strand:+ start:251 stop:703 length:453 start_codon:yes stop_codon:yes gene_type:complete